MSKNHAELEVSDCDRVNKRVVDNYVTISTVQLNHNNTLCKSDYVQNHIDSIHIFAF